MLRNSVKGLALLDVLVALLVLNISLLGLMLNLTYLTKLQRLSAESYQRSIDPLEKKIQALPADCTYSAVAKSLGLWRCSIKAGLLKKTPLIIVGD